MYHFKYILLFLILGLAACSSDSTDPPPKPVDPVDPPPPPPPEPTITDEELLDLTQRETFRYFYDFAEANSSAARERYLPENPSQDANLVTTGGTGFGLMVLIVGIERQFINRPEGTERFKRILGFLENADRFHGAWPHWMDGSTGNVISFSPQDDGADLVETAFLAQGLICVGEYLKNGSDAEKELAQKAFDLVDGIEWNWFTQDQNVLYWHWSPNSGFSINLQLKGYNETLITYILAAASEDFGIGKQVYETGWASDGGIKVGTTTYGIPLLLKHAGGLPQGGPLFWAHCSHLGLNPKNLVDAYANYWDVNVNHTKINYSYCVENPKGYKDYGPDCWGLTASYTRKQDGGLGYSAHRPGNDAGVISPTAAISSIPYTPEESLKAMYYFYKNKDKLLGPAGFYDAFSPQFGFWVAPAYLAIDQGPEIIMIENYRTGLLWNLFMQNENVQKGLTKLGFTYQN